MERPSLSPQREYESDETTQRYNSEGGIYTKRENREATKRWLDRHRDPERLINMGKFAAAVLAPEYYVLGKSIYHSYTGKPEKAAWALAEFLVGRLLGRTEPAKVVDTGRRPDFVPVHEIIPIGRNKVAPKVGSYRGVTPKDRREAQAIGTYYSGPGNYDVAPHATFTVEPGAPIRLRVERVHTNRGDANSIGVSNEARRKAGLYVRPDPDETLLERLVSAFLNAGR